MSFALAGFVLDILVLLALGATIYFALRLSKNLSVIRSDKQELRALIDALSKNVDQANAAIINMRATGSKTADRLQELITQGKLLSEELQIINEAGNSLAGRLERGASKPAPARKAEPAPPPAPETRAAPFFIHDRDFEERAQGNDWDDDEIPESLQTQAERELYAAIRKNQKKSPPAGRH